MRVFAVLLAFLSSLGAQTSPHSSISTPDRTQWFRDAKFGMFIHWGPYAVIGRHEWSRDRFQIPQAQYDAYARAFDPVRFNAPEWVDLAHNAGARYIVITSKHHDGFSIFRSKVSDYDMEITPYGGDPLKDLAEASARRGMRLGFYHSIMDWHHRDYTPKRSWEVKDPKAGGNLDGKNGNEIVACAAGGGSVLAFSADGKPLWTAAASCFMPAIADLDGDGAPEVVVGGGIIDGATGAVKKVFSPVPSGYHTVGDLDGNGKPEIVFANRVYDAAGALTIDLTASISGTWLVPSLVDFDKDGKPEVIATLGDSNSVVLWRYDAAEPSKAKILRAPFKAHVDPGGAWGWSFGMGPITAGDFDGDGTPDAGFVGFRGYVVLDGKKLMNGGLPSTLAGLALWSKPTDEDNGSTGSAVFDFDGDGKVEVLYNDTQRVHIYDGKTGQDTATPICNTTGSLLEYPVVADVDADGQADVVLVANSFSNKPGSNPSYICDGTIQSGVRVLGSASKSWVQTRPVWNQHTYHVTNVREDGTIPAVEPDNWKQPRLNNFRQNVQPQGEFAAPDLVVSVRPNCEGTYALIARVLIRLIPRYGVCVVVVLQV